MAANCWILFLLALSAAAQNVPDHNAPATLEGRVMQGATGESVRKAHVTLDATAAGNESELVATTDDAGRFKFADVAPAVYRLAAEKTGFLGGSYGQTKPDDATTLLKVNAGDRLQDLTLRLFPGGVISGRVLDTDGDPVSGQQVIIWQKRRAPGQPEVSQVGDATTNQAGEYRIDGLSEGTYYASADPDRWVQNVRQIPVDSEGHVSKLHELPTFFPAAVSIADAQAIHIESGQEQTGIDIRMQRGVMPSVKGRIAGITGSASRYALSAGFGPKGESGKILPSGDFSFERLPPGRHTLTLFEHGPNGMQVIGETEITLADQDITGVVITPFKPAEVLVRVVREDNADTPLTKGSVFLLPIENASRGWSGTGAYQQQNGVYTLRNIRPGKYEIGFSNAPDCYLKSVEAAGRMLDPESIDIAEGTNLNLLLIYSPNVASVTGDVEVTQDRPANSVHVLLVSQDTSSPYGKVRPIELDQSLHFLKEHLRPGKYLLFAAEEGNFDLWDNADFVRSLQPDAVEVELHEKQQCSVHLKTIPKDETERIRRQLGI